MDSSTIKLYNNTPTYFTPSPLTMKNTTLGLLWVITLLFYGVASAQSVPSIWANVTVSTISQPYLQSQCVEPGNAIVYATRQFYLWDTYTTRDMVPKWGYGYDTLILSSTKVLVYNSSLFNFTTPIKFRSNGVPNSYTGDEVVSSDGTFIVSNTAPAELVYNVHRAALYNGGNSSYNLNYLWRPDLTNYTATLTNKTFYSSAWRVVDWYECVAYVTHYCGDGVKDTQQSIAALPWGISDSIAAEACDGTDGVTPGYTCNSSCQLVALQQPTCSLTPISQTIVAGQTAVLNYGSHNAISISNLNNIPVGTIVPNVIGSFHVSPVVNTSYGFTVHWAPGTTPVTCSATVNVQPINQPTCTLTPSQTIMAGQNATLNFNTTFTNFITNLVNISGWIIHPDQGGFFVVTPTQTTT